MTAGDVSRDDVREILAGVKHPAIDRTLLELGIIKSMAVEGGNVRVLMAFPFPNIPIGDYLIHSVRGPLGERGIAVEIETTVMDEDELQKFLAMEKEGWTGGI
jgi:metal-sulfur cluster biosynthetic enzyme